MEIAFWIAGGWLTLSVAVALWIAAFIRSGGREPNLPTGVIRPDHAVQRP